MATVTNEQIKDIFQKNAGSNNEAIARFMYENGVTPTRVAFAVGGDTNQIDKIYRDLIPSITNNPVQASSPTILPQTPVTQRPTYTQPQTPTYTQPQQPTYTQPQQYTYTPPIQQQPVQGGMGQPLQQFPQTQMPQQKMQAPSWYSQPPAWLTQMQSWTRPQQSYQQMPQQPYQQQPQQMCQMQPQQQQYGMMSKPPVAYLNYRVGGY